MGKTSIEWTDETWNPTRGCTKVSPGCKHCYAETFAERFRGVVGHPYELGFDPRTAPDKLDEPLHWKKPRMVFVNSMSDLFHDTFSNEYIAAVFGVMAACPQHTFQVLTKRASRLPEWFAWFEETSERCRAVFPADEPPWLREHTLRAAALRHVDMPAASMSVEWPLPNVWLGVSAEDQERWDERLEHLACAPAAVRFVSAEPLLGPIDCGNAFDPQPEGSPYMPIDWVIVGGESGHGARRCETDWIRRIVRQCRAAAVPVFVKQLGASPLFEAVGWRVRDRKGGDPAEWPEDLRVRQFPEVRHG